MQNLLFCLQHQDYPDIQCCHIQNSDTFRIIWYFQRNFFSVCIQRLDLDLLRCFLLFLLLCCCIRRTSCCSFCLPACRLDRVPLLPIIILLIFLIFFLHLCFLPFSVINIPIMVFLDILKFQIHLVNLRKDFF